MAVPTVWRQVGAGAFEIGRLAAQQLQIDYVDQEILVEAARELGVPVESVVSHDERTASIGERLAHTLRHFLERSAAAGATDPMLGSSGLDVVLGRTYSEAAAESHEDVSDERYISTLTQVVRGLARHDNVLIIGRGSQVILQDRPQTIHALLVAPLADRIRRIAERNSVSEEEAAKLVHEGDKGRVSFHRKFFKVDVDDPALYHLTLNTARLGAEEAAGLIGDAARRLADQPA